MNHPKIRMYTTSWCSDCHRAKAFLAEHGHRFEEIDIEQAPEAAETVMHHNDGKRRVPTFEIEGRFYGNPPLDRLAELLAETAAATSAPGAGDDQPLAFPETAEPNRDAFEGIDEQNAEHRSMVIIGTGPAGLTAAIYAARAGLEPLVLRGAQPGGQLTTTTDVENYPGFPEGILGPELMKRFQDQATRFGAELRWGTVTATDFSDRPFRLLIDGTSLVLADTVVISTGASARYLGLENEARLLGYGVSACATCDGAFFRDRKVAVVGGGDTALEEALFLTRFADEVIVIHRRDELRASKILQRRALGHEKIRFVWSSVVEDVLGGDAVEGVVLRHVDTGETTRLDIDGLFIAIGHRPNTDFFRGWLERDGAGYLVTKSGSSRTNVPGVFACGDVQDRHYRQAITAAGTGAMAAIDAENFLAGAESEEERDADLALAS